MGIRKGKKVPFAYAVWTKPYDFPKINNLNAGNMSISLFFYGSTVILFVKGEPY